MNEKVKLELCKKRLETVYEDKTHPTENLETLETYLTVKVGTQVRPETLFTNYAVFTAFSKWCIKPIPELNELDIAGFVTYLKTYTYDKTKGDKEEKQYTANTIYTYKIVIKKFFKERKQFDLAEILKDKRPKNDSDKLDRENLLTEDEVYLQMIPKAINFRDKAILSVLYECGARRGELLACKIKNVDMDYANGCVLNIPSGKTGKRKVRLVRSKSYLQLWINAHPQRDKEGKPDKEAYLFIALDVKKVINKKTGVTEYKYSKLSDAGLYRQLKKIAEKAGITKRCNPRSFRHAAASNLSEHLTDQQLKAYFGWDKASNMTNVYVHSPDTDNAILEMNDIEPDNKKKSKRKVTKVCATCQREIDIVAVVCPFCGFSAKDMVEAEKRKDEELIEKVRKEMREELKKWARSDDAQVFNFENVEIEYEDDK
jgi:integrase/recombinase XerD